MTAPGAPAGTGAVLEVSDLSVSFGGLHAVDRVSLSIEPGQLLGLIGPNGAGKTTFVDALTGFVRASGRIRFDGQEIQGRPPHARARLGIGRTFQSVELFEDLTVRENLLVNAQRLPWWSILTDPFGRRGAQPADVDWALELLGLSGTAHRFPSELSHGQRKLVGVARSLAGRPKLLFLDEPAAGLDTAESRQLGRRLRSVVAEGVTILLVDHDMGLVLGVCDRIAVLQFGALIAEGAPAEIRRDPTVVAAYLGQRTTGPEPPAARGPGGTNRANGPGHG